MKAYISGTPEFKKMFNEKYKIKEFILYDLNKISIVVFDGTDFDFCNNFLNNSYNFPYIYFGENLSHPRLNISQKLTPNECFLEKCKKIIEDFNNVKKIYEFELNLFSTCPKNLIKYEDLLSAELKYLWLKKTGKKYIKYDNLETIQENALNIINDFKSGFESI